MRMFKMAMTGLVVASLIVTGCATSEVQAKRAYRTAAPTVSRTVTPTAEVTLSETATPTETIIETPSETPSETPTPTPEPPPPPPAILQPGDSGEKVRELQHRLRQIEWYFGDITPTYGPSTTKAVTGFQGKRGIPKLGYVDQLTWDKLVAMTEKPTHDQMHNILRPGPAIMKRGDRGDNVKELQARLMQIGWLAGDVDGIYGPVTKQAIEGFQAKRQIPVTGEVDKRTWNRLVAMTRKPTYNELNNIKPTNIGDGGAAAGNLDARCLTGRVVCVSKAKRKLYWVVDGKIVKSMSARFGKRSTPTREGTFRVQFKSRNHYSKLYHSKMPFALFFSGGQAIHYSSDFASRGWAGASHGCVNIRDYNGIAWLFDEVRVGEKVVIY